MKEWVGLGVWLNYINLYHLFSVTLKNHYMLHMLYKDILSIRIKKLSITQRKKNRFGFDLI